MNLKQRIVNVLRVLGLLEQEDEERFHLQNLAHAKSDTHLMPKDKAEELSLAEDEGHE